MAHRLYLVTGAPGAGKSTTVEAMLRLNSEILVFDMDWLLDAASRLAGQDIRFAPQNGQPITPCGWKFWPPLRTIDRQVSSLPPSRHRICNVMGSPTGIHKLSGCSWIVMTQYAASAWLNAPAGPSQ